MPLREYSLGHVLLLKIRDEFDEHDLPKMINVRRATVETCCPVMTRLQAAQLTHRLLPHDDGLHLRFFLQEREKHRQTIPLQGGVAIPKNGDAFRIEAQAVRQALDEVRQNIALVVDPALSFDELTRRTVSSSERRALRQLLSKRRGKQIDLPGFGENPIHAPIVPSTMPVGTPLLVSAEMGAFSREEVILENIRRIDANGTEIVDLELGSSIPMVRDAYGPVAAYNALLIGVPVLFVPNRTIQDPASMRLPAAWPLESRINTEFSDPPPLETVDWQGFRPFCLNFHQIRPLFRPPATTPIS